MTFLDKTASLDPLQKRVIVEKATEYPHTGLYNTVTGHGTYLCRRCGFALFRGDSQFSSGCGWPSFDGAIVNRIRETTDKDGQRTEILCARCDAHLGHVFKGEFLTHKNIRHCVNSAALDFVLNDTVLDTDEAIVAGGCFWGVEHFMQQTPAVLLAQSGYMGGTIEHPHYEQVCQGTTGHYEVVRIVFDKDKASYAQIIKRFFEIHDPTQANGQGPDLGPQYQSAVFYYSEEQKKDALLLIKQLESRGFSISTRLLPIQTFWPAEEHHQQYYSKHHKAPYCHKPVARFEE